MRTLTNKWNSSEVFVKAATQDDHVTKGDISVTTLMDSPQVKILKKNNDYQEDVVDAIHAMSGTAFHTIMEEASHVHREYNALKRAFKALKQEGKIELAKEVAKAAKELYPDELVDKDIFLERTLTLDIEGVNDVTGEPYTYRISGTQDKYQRSTKTLSDYKTVTASKAISPQLSWEIQLNIYAYMLRMTGEDVENLEIEVYIRDWSKVKAMMGGSGNYYPKSPNRTYQLRVWGNDECLNYIKERVHLHYMADNGVVPECTNKEMWSDGDSYAVCGDNHTKALKIFKSDTDALKFIDGYEKKLVNPYIEFRPADPMRCKYYCPVSNICPQKIRRDEFIKSLKQ